MQKDEILQKVSYFFHDKIWEKRNNKFRLRTSKGVAGTATSKSVNNLLTPSMNYLYGINSTLLDSVHMKFIIAIKWTRWHYRLLQKWNAVLWYFSICSPSGRRQELDLSLPYTSAFYAVLGFQMLSNLKTTFRLENWYKLENKHQILKCRPHHKFLPCIDF